VRRAALLLFLAGCGGGFGRSVLWDPAGRRHAAVAGLPNGTVQRLELDQRVSPPSLHVATEQGAAALRVLPP